MRLRQLATTQSVAFFAPTEVRQSIKDVCRIENHQKIDSSHVVTWLLEQTCRANEQLQTLYLAQGTDFCCRMDAQWSNPNFLTTKTQKDALLKVLQHPEQQTLEQLYGAGVGKELISPSNMSSTILRNFMESLRQMRKSLVDTHYMAQSSMLQEVEQEREIEFQVEEVRSVQKPTRRKALTFPGLHSAIDRFAKTGNLTGGEGYLHAFTAFGSTNIGQKYKVRSTTTGLFVSDQFMRSVEISRRYPSNDNFTVR